MNKLLLSGALALTLLLNGCSSNVSLEINETTEQLKYLGENYPMLNITALDENYFVTHCSGATYKDGVRDDSNEVCTQEYLYKNGIFILNAFGIGLRNTDTMMGFIKADSCYFLTPSPQAYEQDEKSFYINVCFVGNTVYLVPDNSLISGDYLVERTNEDFIKFIKQNKD